MTTIRISYKNLGCGEDGQEILRNISAHLQN